jgi:hypothetical protein
LLLTKNSAALNGSEVEFEMPLSKEDLEAHWHLDKKVPLALLTAILAQTVVAAMWVGSTSTRMDTMEKAIMATAPQADRLTRVEVKMDTVVEAVTEIKASLRAATLKN